MIFKPRKNQIISLCYIRNVQVIPITRRGFLSRFGPLLQICTLRRQIPLWDLFLELDLFLIELYNTFAISTFFKFFRFWIWCAFGDIFGKIKGTLINSLLFLLSRLRQEANYAFLITFQVRAFSNRTLYFLGIIIAMLNGKIEWHKWLSDRRAVSMIRRLTSSRRIDLPKSFAIQLRYIGSFHLSRTWSHRGLSQSSSRLALFQF